MIERLLTKPSALVVSTTVLLFWGCSLVLDARVNRITALTPLADARTGLAGLGVLAAGLLSAWALGTVRRDSLRLWALVPGQMVLVMAAAAGIFFAAVGHYGDGEPRAAAFIIADQFPVIALALGHTLGMFKLARRTPSHS